MGVATLRHPEHLLSADHKENSFSFSPGKEVWPL